MAQEHYDVIVVGSGSCGGTMAARLSENPDRQVLVLEAGAIYDSLDALPPSVRDPGDISDALPGSAQNWELEGELREGVRRPVPRGKIMGGSSSINATYFVRGTPANFAEWADLGNDEWTYEKVLPSYIRSESDKDFPQDTTHHGTSGPIPVQREPNDRALDSMHAFTEAALSLGFPPEEDKNATGRLTRRLPHPDPGPPQSLDHRRRPRDARDLRGNEVRGG